MLESACLHHVNIKDKALGVNSCLFQKYSQAKRKWVNGATNGSHEFLLFLQAMWGHWRVLNRGVWTQVSFRKFTVVEDGFEKVEANNMKTN